MDFEILGGVRKFLEPNCYERKEVVESNHPEGEGRMRNLAVLVQKDLFRESKCLCLPSYRTSDIFFPFLQGSSF